MLHDNKGELVGVRHIIEECLEGFQAACGGSDTHHEKRVLILPFAIHAYPQLPDMKLWTVPSTSS